MALVSVLDLMDKGNGKDAIILELLEACKQLLEWYDHPIDRHHKEYMKKRASAAIRHATDGRTDRATTNQQQRQI